MHCCSLSIITIAVTGAYLRYLSLKRPRSQPELLLFVVDPKGKAFSHFLLFPSLDGFAAHHNCKDIGVSSPFAKIMLFLLFFNIFLLTLKVLPSKRGTGVAGDRAPANPSRTQHPTPTAQPPRKNIPAEQQNGGQSFLLHLKGDESVGGEEREVPAAACRGLIRHATLPGQPVHA